MSSSVYRSTDDETRAGQRSEDDRPVFVPYALRTAGAWSWRFIALIGGCWLLFKGLVAVKTLVIPLAISVLLTVLLLPMARWLQRKVKMNPHAASGLLLVGLVVLVVGMMSLAGTQIAAGISGLSAKVSDGIGRITEALQKLPFGNGDLLNQAGAKIQELIQSNSQQIASGALSATSAAGNVITGLVICLFATFFFVSESQRIWGWVLRLFPKPARERANIAFGEGWNALSGYMRTQIVVAAVDAVLIGVGAAILQLPFALPIGVIVFFASFIPIVGALVSGALAVVVALISGSPLLGSLSPGMNSLIAAAIMLGIILLVQQIEGNVLQPFLMGRSVNLHPLAVILAVAAGSLVAGIVGALFAVPLTALVNSMVLSLTGNTPEPEPKKPSKLALGLRKLFGGGKSSGSGGASESGADVERSSRARVAASGSGTEGGAEGADGKA